MLIITIIIIIIIIIIMSRTRINNEDAEHSLHVQLLELSA